MKFKFGRYLAQPVLAARLWLRVSIGEVNSRSNEQQTVPFLQPQADLILEKTLADSATSLRMYGRRHRNITEN
jgi:hypothetical protein